MSPKAEDLLANRFLKAISKSQRNNHYGYTDNGGDY